METEVKTDVVSVADLEAAFENEKACECRKIDSLGRVLETCDQSVAWAHINRYGTGRRCRECDRQRYIARRAKIQTEAYQKGAA